MAGKEQQLDDLKKFLLTPQDISSMNYEDKANVLALHFIGYVAKPKGIDEATYKKCIEAFDNNRGKTEKEAEAILKVLKDEEK